MTTRRLVLVRHAEAEGASGRCIGQTDLPLSPGGRAAARAAAAHVPRDDVTAYASDRARARETAALLLGADGAASEDAALREAHFGAWEGRTWAELEATDGARLGAWMADWVQVAPPGGESFAMVRSRVARWLDAHRAPAADARPLLVVTHAGAIRAALVSLLDVDASRAFAFGVDLLHAHVLDVGRHGATLVRGNVPLACAFP